MTNCIFNCSFSVLPCQIWSVVWFM